MNKMIFNLRYIAIGIILIVSIGVYLNSLPNSFIYDDEFQVLENQWIRDVKHIPDIFLSDVWAFDKSILHYSSSNYYRPIMHIIYMVNYHIFGLRPWGFHLTNIIFHSMVTVMVFLIASILLNESQSLSNLLPPLVAALLFATHPIHTEVVTWVASIPELSFTFFYLLSFYLYVKASSRVPGIKYLFSLFFFLLSLLCKEQAMTLPFLLIIYDCSLRKDFSFRIYHPLRTIGNFFLRYLPYLIIAGVYSVLRINVMGSFAPQKTHAYLSTYECFINIFPLFAKYIKKIIIPINLNALYSFNTISSILKREGIISLALTLIFIYFLYISWNKNRVIFFSLLWITVSLLPVLYIPILGAIIFNERYLYLPSVGFVILIAMVLKSRWQVRVFKTLDHYVMFLTILLLICLYAAEAVNRNYAWRDEYSLWSDTVKKSPDSYIAHGKLGNAYLEQGRFEDAIKEYQITLNLNPNFPSGHNNIGIIYYNKGKIEEAVKEFKTALKLNPDDPEAHNSLGNVYYDQGRLEEAIKEYQIALRLKPNYPEAHYNLGTAYYSQHRFEDAIMEYQTALRLKPAYAEAYLNLGNTYYSQGWLEEAIKKYQAALKLKPTYAEAHYNLGIAYKSKGLLRDAIEEFKSALKISPGFVQARQAIESSSK